MTAFSSLGFDPAALSAGEPLTPALQSRLTQSLEADPISCLLWGEEPAAIQAVERARILAKAGAPFARWWRAHVPGADVPWDSLWRVSIPFACWILQQKRRRPERLFMVGVNGTIGAGKSVFSEGLAVLLSELLLPAEGRAVARSLDDYYLPKSIRDTPEFRARGYDAGPGVSNRGPAGTHDVLRLWSDIGRLEQATPQTMTGLPNFDKQADDRRSDDYPFLGQAAIYILEGWFVGCETSVPLDRLPPGLKRTVGEALAGYGPVFDRLDALWAFEPLPFDQIVDQRLKAQAALDQKTGRKGMAPEVIRRFVRYFYEEVWTPGVTSPHPDNRRVSFWARTDTHHQFLAVRRGGKP